MDTYGSERRGAAKHGDHHHIGAAVPAVHVAGTGDHGGAGHLQLHRDDHKEHQGITGPLHHRSGSSSSSFEDDGEGGGRKKGMKEKVKEKLPGVSGHSHHEHEKGADHGTHEHHHEKKSIMEKIKEKLPGSHDHHRHEPSAAAVHNHVHDHEKKGTMEKIKEKLHGHHHH